MEIRDKDWDYNYNKGIYPKQPNPNNIDLFSLNNSLQIRGLTPVAFLVIIGLWQTQNTLQAYDVDLEPTPIKIEFSPSLSKHTLDKKGSPNTPSVRETAAAAKTYKEAVKSLETPTTLTDEEVKRQGFAIRPIESFKLHKQSSTVAGTSSDVPAPSPTPPTSSNTNLKFGINAHQFTKNVQKESQNLQRQAKRFVESFSSNNFGARSAPFSNYQSGHYYSMDEINKRLLITNAKSLESGASKTLVKRLLGRPTKETIVSLPENNELAKILVYAIKLWRQGVSTPNKDENLILVFDSTDNLVSIEFNESYHDMYAMSQLNQSNRNYPKLADVSRR